MTNFKKQNCELLQLLLLSLVVALFLPAEAGAFQGREHLTEQEVESVRDTQVLDKRIEVFIKAANRRVLALNGGPVPQPKQTKKDPDALVSVPVGSRAELIGDIAKIFDEAITNIDDVSMRDEKNPLISKSLRKLAAAAAQIVEQLKPVVAQAKDDLERSSFDQVIENAESIVQAASRLAPDVDKKAKTKAEKN